MKNNFIEVAVGAFVLTLTFICIVYAYKKADLKIQKSGIHVIAKFDHADGISNGSDIKIAGVKIGIVDNYRLDTQTYRAVMDFYIDKNISLPKDSSAQIVSDGLLGGKYIAIVPGADEENLQNDDEIRYTQSSVNVENLISKMVFSTDKK